MPESNTKKSTKISILGAGKVGQALAKLWLQAGHSVCLGSRHPEKLIHIAESLGSRLSVKTLREAAQEGEVVLIAVPYSATEELANLLSDDLAGKVVLDACNPFGFSSEGRVISTLSDGMTEGTRMAGLLSKSIVIRAFSHIMDELLVSRGTSQAGLWAVAIAGDVTTAKLQAADLVHDAGFVPVDIGTLAKSAPLDPGGALFPRLLTEADMRALLNPDESAWQR